MGTALEPTEPGGLVVSIPIRPDQHPAAVYLARLAPTGRRFMRHALDEIAGVLTSGQCNAETLAWHQLRYQHTAAVRTALAARYKPSTANTALAALRGTLKEAWRLGLVDAESYYRAVDLPPVRGSSLPAGRAVSQGEELAIFKACADDKTAAGARDGALLAILAGAGLRRSEVVALDLMDYDRETSKLTIQNGKGRKARICFLKNGGSRWRGATNIGRRGYERLH